MNITFIVGCARSGTSILGELIASHPAVKYIFEAHSIWELGGMGEDGSHRLTAEHVSPAIKAEIESWFRDQAQDTHMLVEKNPRNILRIPYIREIFPEAKLIHIIRDGRDVACSMIPGAGGTEWYHLRPPSWKSYYDAYSGAIRCAFAWRDIVEIGLQDLQNVSHLQIRYEDLVFSPNSTIRSIFSYMGLDLHPAVIEFGNQIANNTTFAYHASHQDRWFQNNHHKRIGRWRENLTRREQEKINELLTPLLDRLGYSTD
ncbi:MAG TPA: sulfotransferase [Acidobacteriota bacterium]|nr:sulfotransferase [Acidobacteriota bacterium]